MSGEPQLHSSIVSMVSLAAGIAAGHPSMGSCQLKRLREQGVPAHQIQMVVEIARHIRAEAAQQSDADLDKLLRGDDAPVLASVDESATAGCCTTAGGQSCC